MEIDAYLDIEQYTNNITLFVGGEILTKNNQTQYILISHTIIIEVLIPIPRVAFSSTSPTVVSKHIFRHENALLHNIIDKLRDARMRKHPI